MQRCNIVATLFRKFTTLSQHCSPVFAKNRRWESSRITSSLMMHVHHAFLYVSLQSLQTATWNDQFLSWLENGKGKVIYLSLWTRTRSPLFNSNLTFLLSSNWVTWYNGEKVLKDAKSTFQRRFHWRRRCRIVRSLTYINMWTVSSDVSIQHTHI